LSINTWEYKQVDESMGAPFTGVGYKQNCLYQIKPDGAYLFSIGFIKLELTTILRRGAN
jgi:hypothetical protein